jgi:hypothetical protein
MTEVKVTVLPPGRAEGWDDLQRWSARRAGVPESAIWKKAKRETKARERRLKAAGLKTKRHKRWSPGMTGG